MNRVNLIYYTGNTHPELIDSVKNGIKTKLDELYKDDEFGYSLSNGCNLNFADYHLGRFVDAPYRYFCGDDWFIVNSSVNLFLMHRYFYHKLKHFNSEDKMDEFLSIYGTEEKLFSDKLKCGEDENIIIDERMTLTKLKYHDNLTLSIMLHKFKQDDDCLIHEGEDGAIMESSYRKALNELGLVLIDKELF